MRVTLIAALAVLVSPCVSAAQRIVFFPDWFPGAQFAGLYVALDGGHFRAAGIDVELRAFAFGQDTPRAIAADPAVAAIASSEGYIFVQRRAAGADLVAFTAVLRDSPAGIISLASNSITNARDFAGRRIGVHAHAEGMLRWFAREAGLRDDAWMMVSAGNDLDNLARGELDALQGYAIEEAVLARQRFGGEVHFVSFRELGFDSYAQVLYTTRAQSTTHAATHRAFMAALRRGWEQVIANPDAALPAVMRRLEASADPETVRAMLHAVAPYVAPRTESPLAPFDFEKWRRMQRACVAMELIARVEAPEVFCLPP